VQQPGGGNKSGRKCVAPASAELCGETGSNILKIMGYLELILGFGAALLAGEAVKHRPLLRPCRAARSFLRNPDRVQNVNTPVVRGNHQPTRCRQ
jgi:hypothetical protein